MWERDIDRIALLELYLTGRLPRRRRQPEAWALLDDLPWTRRTGRRGVIELAVSQQNKVIQLLNRVWPEWGLVRDGLLARGLNPTPEGLSRLHDLLRAETVALLPERLNRRTATAAVAPHSKSTLSSVRRDALGKTKLTGDGIVRLRAPTGVRFARGTTYLNAADIASVFGEVAITERALLDGAVLVGDLEAVLLVENLGPYLDLEPPEGWLVVHVPGWDTATARLFLAQLREIPVVLFGDLDPAGVRIARHLRQLHSKLIWTVPPFWGEYLEKRALPGEWPDDLDLSQAPPLVQELGRRGLWLEQEVISVDPRLRAALQAALS